MKKQVSGISCQLIKWGRHIFSSLQPPTTNHQPSSGFTLIELLVVTAIVIIVSTLILANNARFGGAVILENLAYDVGLSVRKAQVYGIAVRRFGATDFSSGYGIHFDITTPSAYVLFADVFPTGTGDGIYEPEASELVESLSMLQGYRMLDLCATSGGGLAEACGIDTIDILFKRPEPDAFISANGVSGVANPGALHERARVILQSPRGDEISVIVEATGQIAVQKI